mgnify:CR=1 FL=1
MNVQSFQSVPNLAKIVRLLANKTKKKPAKLSMIVDCCSHHNFPLMLMMMMMFVSFILITFGASINKANNDQQVVNKQLSNKNDNHSGIIIDNDDHRKQLDEEYEISLDYNNNDGDDNSDRETRTMIFSPFSSKTNMTTTKTMLIDDTSIMNDADKFINDELNKFHVEESLLCKNSFILNSFILTMKIIFFVSSSS